MIKNWMNDTWERFNDASHNKKVILYGAGKRCREWLPLWDDIYNIPYIVDSDTNKWGTDICGKKVFSPDKILEEEPGTYIVLICGQYAGEIAAGLEKQPVCGGGYYSEYWMNNAYALYVSRIQTDIPQERVDAVCDFLADEESKECLRKIVEKRRQGACDYSDIMCVGEYFRDDIFGWKTDEVYVDAGAYDGDSILEFVKKNRSFKKIYAFEADPSNYERLGDSYIYQAYKDKIQIFNKGLWDRHETVSFTGGLKTGSSMMIELMDNADEYASEQMQKMLVDCIPLDDMVSEKVTFIKMDIEGSEMHALAGAKNIITKYKPKLAVCIYHMPDDLWRIPEYIHSMVPEYRIFIRHHSLLYVDTVLYATI